MANSQVVVVVVPFPAQGHLTPLLRLSRRLSTCNIPVHYIASATHIRQATTRVHGGDPSTTTNLHFHSFPTPQFQNLQPSSSSSYKYPTHLKSMVVAVLSHFHEPFHHLINELSSQNPKRIVLIFDSLMASLVRSVHSLVESYCFESVSAFTSCSSHWEVAGKPNVPPEVAVVLEELPSREGCCSTEFLEYMALQHKSRTFHSGTLYNISRLVDGLYLDLLSELRVFGSNKHWAVGPLNPVFKEPGWRSSFSCLEWLEKQPKNSVMFVSFGTSSSLTDEQISELALGLERSGCRFIWALRDADKGDVFEGDVRREDLPQGFEERVGERGIVVRDWAPQLEIMEHSATGGFMSHCGWNSCMESISMGVPIAAWPMHSDQPRNALLITKVLKIGVDVRDWACRNEIVSSVLVAEAVRRVIASAEGDEMRKMAEKLADSIKQSMMEGGDAKMEMDSFVTHITR